MTRSSPVTEEVLIENLIQAAHEYEQAEGSAAKYLRGEYSKARHALREYIAQLQYEAGTYKSLYENAFAQTASPSSADIGDEKRDIVEVMEELSGVIEGVRGDRDVIRVSGRIGNDQDVGVIGIDGLQELLKRACEALSAPAQPSADTARLADELQQYIDNYPGGPPKHFLLKLHAALSAPAQPMQNRDDTLRGLAEFFSESVHHVWSNDEIAHCLTEMIGQGSSVPSTHRQLKRWPEGCWDQSGCRRNEKCSYPGRCDCEAAPISSPESQP